MKYAVVHTFAGEKDELHVQVLSDDYKDIKDASKSRIRFIDIGWNPGTVQVIQYPGVSD